MSFLASDEDNFNLVLVNDDLERAYRQFRDFITETFKNILSRPKNQYVCTSIYVILN